MDTKKRTELLMGLTEISTEKGMRLSAKNILKGLDQFSHIGADFSTMDIAFVENKAAYSSQKRKGNK